MGAGSLNPMRLVGVAVVVAVSVAATALSGAVGASVRASVRTSVVGGPGFVSASDPVGDADRRADISNLSATMAAGRIRLGLTLPSTPDPGTDVGWQSGLSYAAWNLDVNADAAPDATVLVVMEGTRSFGLVISPDGSILLCNANVSYRASAHTFSASVAQRCVGAWSHVDIQASAAYDTDPFGAEPHQVRDSAPATSWLALDAGPATAVPAAGYVADGFGGLHAVGFGGRPPSARPRATFGFDIVRGVAATPDGGHAYTVDGFGGLHTVDIGANADTFAAVGGTYWRGWDIARGVAIAASGRGGYVLDGFGALHPFGIGDARSMPAALDLVSWPGWDIARGVAVLPNGRGGFTLDGFGGLHWFSFGRSRRAPALTGAAYWPDRDIARGVALLPDGSGGYVVDAAGVLYPFGINAPAPAVPSGAGPVATRGITLVPAPLALPPAAVGGP